MKFAHQVLCGLNCAKLLTSLIKVLNKKFNRLRIEEFSDKLYAPFKSKEEDKKNAVKTSMLLVSETKVRI